MATTRSHLESSKVSKPPRRYNLLQPEPSRDLAEPLLPLKRCSTFGSSSEPCLFGAFVPCYQTGPPPQPFSSTFFPSGDGDSGYSGSPEVNEEGSLPTRPPLDLLGLEDPDILQSIPDAWFEDIFEGTTISDDLLYLSKQELPNHTDTTIPSHELSNWQTSSFPQIPKVSTLQSTLSASANTNPTGHPQKASLAASSKREQIQEEIHPTELRRITSIREKQAEALPDQNAWAGEDCSQDPTPNSMPRKTSIGSQSQSDLDPNVKDTAKLGVLQWVDETKDASSLSSFTPPAIRGVSTSNESSPAAPVQVLSPRESSASSSRALVLEFWSILQDRDPDYDVCKLSQADETTECPTDDIHSPRTSTNGSGSDGSPNSSATSNSTPVGLVSKSALSTNKRSREEEGDEDGCPNRRPTRQQGVHVQDAPQNSTYPGQMSCPMLELHDCQGTNTTISELMRSLLNRHRIVICKECCTRLTIPDEEKRPVNVLQKHASSGCERYCIGTSCANGADDTTSFHRRTERCPSWAALTKEERWTFLWRLVNPESNPPEPNFLPGPAFEHSQVRRPCKQQARARGNEICAQLMRDIEAKERRISTLENDLITAKNENIQKEQRCNEKTVNLENIIESLLERLCENRIGLPGSLRKRLQNECPEAMAAIFVKESQTVSTLPTSTLTPNHGYYPGSGVSSTWGNMTCPPPTMPTMPVTWDAVPQQMVGSNLGYHFPDFSEKAPTTSEMYPTDACISDWNSISMSPSTMHGQVGRYSSSETPETVQPCE